MRKQQQNDSSKCEEAEKTIKRSNDHGTHKTQSKRKSLSSPASLKSFITTHKRWGTRLGNSKSHSVVWPVIYHFRDSALHQLGPWLKLLYKHIYACAVLPFKSILQYPEKYFEALNMFFREDNGKLHCRMRSSTECGFIKTQWQEKGTTTGSPRLLQEQWTK